MTFLGKDRVFYTVPGLDYISHNDILPYDTFPPTDKEPIYHSLFTKFLAKVPVENEEESKWKIFCDWVTELVQYLNEGDWIVDERGLGAALADLDILAREGSSQLSVHQPQRSSE